MKVFKVIVVDDSALFRSLLSEIINSDKRLEVVATAEDPYQAREQIKKHKPDVITLDIEMPRMNGLELLAQLQKDEKLASLPIAMLTSRGAQKMRNIAASRGANGYFVKPYVEDELLKAAERMMNGEMLIEGVAEDS